MKKVLLTCVVLALVALGGVIAAFYLKQYVGNRFHRMIRTAVREVLEKDAQDIRRRTRCVACEQTAVFVLEEMPNVPAFLDPYAIFDHSIGSVDPELNGLYCEFGVWKGLTINYIAARTNQTVHGFDSFEGLPETWRTGFEKGKFKVSGLPEVRENVKLHKGWFKDSLPVWSKEYSGPIAFMHVDADLYSSTKTVFDVLGDRIVPGTIIQFDEYFNYPGWQEKGEYKAFMEFVESREVQFEYLAYCYVTTQVSVRILSVGSATTN